MSDNCIRHKEYRVLPYITIAMLIFIVAVWGNFQSFVYNANTDDYTAVDAKITKQSSDGLLALVPKIYVTYEYEGKSYNSSFLFYNSIIFRDNKLNDNITLYLNKKSPSDFIYVHDFWNSYLSIGLIIVLLIDIVILINNVRRGLAQYVRECYYKEIDKEAHKILKQEQKSGK